MSSSIVIALPKIEDAKKIRTESFTKTDDRDCKSYPGFPRNIYYMSCTGSGPRSTNAISG